MTPIRPLRRLAVLAALAAATTAPAAPAAAESHAPARVCAPRADMLAYMQETLDETRAARGITFEGALLEIFASEEGTWTALMTRPGEDTCVATFGEEWEILRPPAAPEPSA